MDKPPQYFEGTLQLRNPTQEIIDFVADEIDKRDNVWIAKTMKQKRGVDLLISSNRFLREIGKRLKAKFPGALIESRTLFTQHKLTSKQVYRGCVCFRYVDVKKGDTIRFKGDQYKVIASGKDILAKNLETNKKMKIRFEQLV